MAARTMALAMVISLAGCSSAPASTPISPATSPSLLAIAVSPSAHTPGDKLVPTAFGHAGNKSESPLVGAWRSIAYLSEGKPLEANGQLHLMRDGRMRSEWKNLRGQAIATYGKWSEQWQEDGSHTITLLEASFSRPQIITVDRVTDTELHVRSKDVEISYERIGADQLWPYLRRNDLEGAGR